MSGGLETQQHQFVDLCVEGFTGVQKITGFIQKKENKTHVQHIFSEAPLPFSLVKEVVEVAAEGDEDKAKSEESKNT